MAQARAVVDVVRPEPGANELLEQVRFLVRTFGRSETGQRPRAALCADLCEPAGRQIKGFVPGRLAEGGEHFVIIDDPAGFSARPPAVIGDDAREGLLGIELGPTDEGRRQSLRMERVVPAVPSLDAQALVIDRTLTTIGSDNLASLLVPGHRASHATVGTDAVDRLQLVARDNGKRHRLVDKGPCRADGGTFAARDARAIAHRPVEVETDRKSTRLNSSHLGISYAVF